MITTFNACACAALQRFAAVLKAMESERGWPWASKILTICLLLPRTGLLMLISNIAKSRAKINWLNNSDGQLCWQFMAKLIVWGCSLTDQFMLIVRRAA